MAEYIVMIVNEIDSKEEVMLNRIEFHKIYHESILSNLYTHEVGYDDDHRYTSGNNWKDIDSRGPPTLYDQFSKSHIP